MPFRGLQLKSRNDPLGPGGLSGLSQNLSWVRKIAQTEHIIGTGEHNAWQIPRRCFTVAADGTSVTPSTGDGDVPSASRPATGTYALTLAADRFSTSIRPQLNINSDQVRTKPCIIGYTVNSATSVNVYLKRLSSALGSGNSWAALNSQFDVALHSDPLARGSYQADAFGHARGDTLTEESTDWNATVQAHGSMHELLRVGHDAAGAHDVAEVAKYYAHVNFVPGGSPSYEVHGDSSGGIGVNRVSDGIVEVSYSALSAPQFAFVSPDYQRYYSTGTPDNIYSMHAECNGTTQHTVYIYQYDALTNSWDYGDADFFIAIYGS